MSVRIASPSAAVMVYRLVPKEVVDDKGEKRMVNFDTIYATVFEPAVRAATLPPGEGGRLEPRRTDKDFFSGDISREMFEYMEYATGPCQVEAFRDSL